MTWTGLGQFLGGAYGVYALGLVAGCLGVHALLLLIYWWRSRRGTAFSFATTMELTYGLVNPVVYLVVFQPGLFRQDTPSWLPGISWALLVAYWGYRVFGSAVAPRAFHRHFATRLLSACMALAIAVGVRDLVSAGAGFYAVLIAPLYVFPIFIAYRQLALIRKSPFHWEELLFLESRVARAYASGALIVVGVTIAVSLLPRLERQGRALVLSQQQSIRDSARKYAVDPRLLAALISVTHREHSTPFRAALEETIAGIWSFDSKSHMLLAGALDPSLGLAQIKPVTLLTAYGIHRCSDCRAKGYWSEACGGTEDTIWSNSDEIGHGRCWWQLSKEYREVKLSRQEAARLSLPSMGSLPLPLEAEVPTKDEVVTALAEPQTNIASAAFLLALYAAQWRESDPSWAIDGRPEILATLFQIGFQRSVPKPGPQPNTFGLQVAAEMNEPWIIENF